MTLRTRHGFAAAAMLLVALACSAPGADGEASANQATAPVAESAIQVIDHLTPARDSVGPAPTLFSWTRVPGATRYAIGVWDDVDTLQWRRDDIPEAKIARPAALTLEPGTYFWSITALRGDEPVGESGRAAFVVREP